jgi:hypothetical protein
MFTVNEEKTSDYVQEIHNVFRLLIVEGCIGIGKCGG